MRRGQAALEWVVFVAVAITVMVSMRGYLVSLVAGRWRQMADQFGYGRQYEPCVGSHVTPGVDCTEITSR